MSQGGKPVNIYLKHFNEIGNVWPQIWLCERDDVLKRSVVAKAILLTASLPSSSFSQALSSKPLIHHPA